jgi:hypothetical protein
MASEKFKMKDITYGVIVPVLVGLLIIAFATVIRSFLVANFDMESPIPHILTFGFAQMIIYGVPMMLGLIWNKWAGGAAGFIMGSIYYLAMAGYSTGTYAGYGLSVNFFADASLITYIVVGILIGYMSGALSNKSYNFKRMLGAGMTAGITTALLQFLVNYQFAIPENRAMTTGDPAYAFFLVIVPQIALAILVPIVAKVFTWYGLAPGGYS